MSFQDPFHQTATLDEVLLDVAVLIELSPRDRRIAENRYRLLKEYLERDESPLAPYLIDGTSMIYAAGIDCYEHYDCQRHRRRSVRC